MLTSTAVGDRGSVEKQIGTDPLADYEAYRRRQARGLLRVLPRDAIRPLYRRAIKAGFGTEDSDPIGALVSYCETLIPLPPFDIWRDDVRANPAAHLFDVDDSADAPGVGAPVTVETRRFTYGRLTWTAHLRSFRDGVTWRGFIAFEDPRSGRVARTAVIFRESDPVDLRDRFLSFESSALVAFLRSALP